MSQTNGQLYIRLRGKMQGPYSTEQLQAFARRGQFSRTHEVSSDGVSWVRASNYPQLFSNEIKVLDASQPVSTTTVQDEIRIGPPQGGRQKPGGGGEWHYTIGGAELGPVDFATLQGLVSQGRLGASDVVWTDGMADWLPPSRVPALAGAGSGGADSGQSAAPAGVGGTGGVTAQMLRASSGMRPWMMFVAVVIFLASAFVAFLGVTSLFQGGISTAFGLVWLVFSGLSVALGVFLVICFNRLGLAVHTKQVRDFEEALASQRRFWFFFGVVLIVGMIIMLMMFVTSVILFHTIRGGGRF